MSSVVLVVVAVVVLIGATMVVVRRRRPSSTQLDGVDRFRRHMDALSSDARRDVIDRVRDARRGDREQ